MGKSYKRGEVTCEEESHMERFTYSKYIWRKSTHREKLNSKEGCTMG